MSGFEDEMREEFEAELRQEIMRVQAPEGFTGRVMERVAGEERRRRQRQRVWLMPIAAMLLLSAVGGGVALRRERAQRQQAMMAQHQFEAAMQVTERSLERVQLRLEDRLLEGER